MATVQNANFIQYGRRAGKSKPKSAKKARETENDSEQGVMIGPMAALDGTDLRQIKVLPRQEWDRIQQSLHSNEREMERIRQVRAEKETLHAESKEIVQNWSNTIAGQRQMKLQARKLREAKEEENRVKIDIEEAQFQASKRKEAIEKAKTTQYYQTDRIKSFHGALLLTEVLKEREAQVELKKQKEASSVGKDQELLKHYREEYERGTIEDQKNAKDRYLERKKVAEYQKMQTREHDVQREKEKVDDKREGVELQKLAKLHEWEQKKLEEVRKKEKMNIMQSHKDHVLNKAAIHALEEQKEEEEEEEIRLFAAAKKRMLKLRKEKEAHLFKEVMDHKDRMTNRLAAQLKQKVDDEDVRIKKATEEKEMKLQREIAQKQEKLQQDLAAITAHRNEQLALKEQKTKEDRQNALEHQEMKLEADQVFAAKQAERRKNQRETNKKLQEFHLEQVNERAAKERGGREDDLYHDEKLLQLHSIEEEQFQQYANKVISEAKKKDRNPYPLYKASLAGSGGGRGPQFNGKGGIRPSYLTTDGYGVQLPNNQRSTTESIKSKSDVGDASVAKKRLGFVW
ncbi:unnamed protein product [Clavelina lepadiformis]|uniref:Trichohyalin-plectin-homology domain-containing protein n=2 Tax=Clavelina lepadiformis TaxID=159417 RepID=A0ABP0F435_CLALP